MLLKVHIQAISNFHTGSGSFGNVYKVKRKSDLQIYALKKVQLGKLLEKEKQNALNEVRILASVNHPSVVAYKEAFIEESILHIIMEYAEGGDLQHKIEKQKETGENFSEEEIWKTFL